MSRGRILSVASLVILSAALFLWPFISSAASPGFNVTFFASVLAACVLSALARLFGSREGGNTIAADSMAYLFLVVLGAGYVRSPDRAGAIDSFYPMAAALLAYLLASRLGFEQRARDVLLASLCAALVLVALWGIYQYFYGLEELRERAMTEGWVLDELTRARLAMERVYAGFVSPNALAGFIALVAPILFCFILKSSRPYLVCLLQVAAIGSIIFSFRTQSIALMVPSFAYAGAVFLIRRRISLKGLRVAGILPVALVLACLIFTGSKSVYIIFAIACFLLATMIIKKGRLLLFLGAIMLILISFFVTYGTDIRRNVDLAIGARMDYWRGATGVIKEYPLIGIGLGSFWCEYQRHAIPGADLVKHAHNSYLEIWAELGFPGLILFIAIIGFSIVRGLRRGAGLINAGAAIGLLAFAIHNLVDFDLYVPEIGLAAFAVAGLLTSSGEGSASRSSNYIFIGVCLALFIVFGPRFQADQAAPELEWQMRNAIQGNDAETARKILPQALRSGPHRARLRVMTGDLFIMEGDVDRAIGEYHAAVDSNSHWARPHLRLARAHASMGEKEGALEEARKAAELSPTSAEVRVVLAAMLGDVGKHDESLLEYRKALDLQRAAIEKDEKFNRATLGENRAFLKSIEDRLEVHREER